MARVAFERNGEDYDSLQCYIQQVEGEIEKVLDANTGPEARQNTPLSQSHRELRRSKSREKQKHPPETMNHLVNERTRGNGLVGSTGGGSDTPSLDTTHPQLARDRRWSAERGEEFERRKAAICFGIGAFRPSRENSPKEVLFRSESQQEDRGDLKFGVPCYSNSGRSPKKYNRSLSDSIKPAVETSYFDLERFNRPKRYWLNNENNDEVFLHRSHSNISNDSGVGFSSFVNNNNNNNNDNTCDIESSQHDRDRARHELFKHISEKTNSRAAESFQHKSHTRCIYCFSKIVGRECQCRFKICEKAKIGQTEDDFKRKQRAELLSQIYEDVKKVTRPVPHSNVNGTVQPHTHPHHSGVNNSHHHHQSHNSSRQELQHQYPIISAPRNFQDHPDEITLQDNLLKSVQSIIQTPTPHSQIKQRPAKHKLLTESSCQTNSHQRSQSHQSVENQTNDPQAINTAAKSTTPLYSHHTDTTRHSNQYHSPTNSARTRGHSDSDLDYLLDILEYDHLFNETGNENVSTVFVLDTDSNHPPANRHRNLRGKIDLNDQHKHHQLDPRHSLYQKVVKPKGQKFRRMFSSEESLIIPPPPGFGAEEDDDVMTLSTTENDVMTLSTADTVTSSTLKKDQRPDEDLRPVCQDFVSELLNKFEDDEANLEKELGLGLSEGVKGWGESSESVQVGVGFCSVGGNAAAGIKDTYKDKDYHTKSAVGLKTKTGLLPAQDKNTGVMDKNRSVNPSPSSSLTQDRSQKDNSSPNTFNIDNVINCGGKESSLTPSPPRHKPLPSSQQTKSKSKDCIGKTERKQNRHHRPQIEESHKCVQIINENVGDRSPNESGTDFQQNHDHGECDTTAICPFESFTNDLSESSYKILTYSSDSFQTDDCDVGQYYIDPLIDSTRNIDNSTDYLQAILQENSNEIVDNDNTKHLDCQKQNYRRVLPENDDVFVNESTEIVQTEPSIHQNYFENPLHENDLTNESDVANCMDMNSQEELLRNGSLQHRNQRLFRKVEKVSPPHSAIKITKHDQVASARTAPLSLPRKFSLDQSLPFSVQEDLNNNQLYTQENISSHVSTHPRLITNGLVDKREATGTDCSRKDRQRYRLKDTAIQTPLDLNDTVDISGMPASEGFTVKRSSISHIRRMSKEKSPAMSVTADDAIYATVNRDRPRAKIVDYPTDKTPPVPSPVPEIPPRKTLISRSKSLQTGHHHKKSKKSRKNFVEKPSLSGSLKELSHLNIDVSQRLVDGEKQYVVDNGSPEMQVIVNALTPVLLRRSKSGRASGKRRFGGDLNENLRNLAANSQRDEDDNVFTEIESQIHKDTEGHQNLQKKHSTKSQTKVERSTSSKTLKAVSSETNTDDHSERRIPIYARIRSHDGTQPCREHTIRSVRKKDFYEISKELQKISRGSPEQPPKSKFRQGSIAKQKVTKSVEIDDDNSAQLQNDAKNKESLFLDPKLAHTWHGQGITDLGYRSAPRMGVGMVFIETTKLLGGPEKSRQFRNKNTNFSISSKSSSVSSPPNNILSSCNSHAQTLPIISRTLLDAMHKRYCSHQYAQQTSTTLQPFSLLKIDPSSSQGGEPITALRVEPRSPQDHEVKAAPPSLTTSTSSSSSSSSSSHPRPTAYDRRFTSEGEFTSESRSSTNTSVQSSPRQKHLSESDAQKQNIDSLTKANEKSSSQNVNSLTCQKADTETGCDSSSQRKRENDGSESLNRRELPREKSDNNKYESGTRQYSMKLGRRRKNSKTPEEIHIEEVPEMEAVNESALCQESVMVTHQAPYQHYQGQHLQQQHHQGHIDRHHHHQHDQHHHHHQQQQPQQPQQQQHLQQQQQQQDDEHQLTIMDNHDCYHDAALELQSSLETSTGSTDSGAEERLSHHRKSAGGE